ncbi:MAG: DUF3667 domain-containing protein [Gammaproteobacteria bacterium]|jgi:hypothetical protein|nr:DUF3667 domain-containing protein [Gammaproteobacteria bacterium]|tara:strand:+ start:84 stop:1094 length:1011 start_codon:yes stop_codon:yes gene_type:complete
MTDPLVAEESIYANCGYPLTGNFCANCGQQDKEVRRPFLHFLNEMLRVMFELDGRAYRTVYYLLTKLGFLAREYFGGRRTSYTAPLRLFLIMSIGFFLLVSTVTSLQSMQSALVEDAPASAEETTTEASAALQDAGVDTDPEELRLLINGDEASEEDIQELLDLISGIHLPFLSEETNQSMNRVIVAQSEANYQEVLDDPQGFFLDSLEYITFFMLLMMPLLALIQRLLFVFARHYYVEHLVLTLHNHAFIIFAFFLSLLVGMVEDLQLPIVSVAFGYIGIALTFWMFMYLYLSLKVYFQRGYILTGIIFLTTSLIYSIVLGMGIAVFAVLMFILA